uniref:Uncharacterized protein n=1 Tax=Anguilla anguilla TaxID=7936 RepID=A0A0E9X6J9_ANGAN
MLQYALAAENKSETGLAQTSAAMHLHISSSIHISLMFNREYIYIHTRVNVSVFLTELIYSTSGYSALSTVYGVKWPPFPFI